MGPTMFAPSSAGRLSSRRPNISMHQASLASGSQDIKPERKVKTTPGKTRAVVISDEDEDEDEDEEVGGDLPATDDEGDADSGFADAEQDTWPPEFDPADPLRPLTLPFFRVDQDAAVTGTTALHQEVKEAQTRAAAQRGAAETKPRAHLSTHMARLPQPPTATASAGSAPTHCSSAFLPAPDGLPAKLLLFQLPTRLPIAPEPASTSSFAAAEAAAETGEIPAGAPATREHAAAMAAGLASNAALTSNQVSVAKVRALAEYTEASLDPNGAAAALRGLGDGRIGTLKLYRSGRCTMVIGDCEFEMSRGVVPRQLQEVARVAGIPAVDWRAGVPSPADAESIMAAQTRAEADVRQAQTGATATAAPAGDMRGQYQILGAITEKIVVTPNVAQLLRQRRNRAAV